LAGIGSVSILPLAASNSRAASTDRPKYYEITGQGDIKYVGPDKHDETNHLAQAVEGFNEAKDRGEIRFEKDRGRVMIIPNQEAESQSAGASSSTASLSGDASLGAASSCPGKDDYQTKVHWQGLRHIFWLDDCTSTELRNKLVAGAVLSEVAALLATATGVGAGAAAAAGAAGILMGGGATLITANNEGKGIKLWFHGPNLLDIDIFELRAQ
jgi:hypothetical protein